MGSKAALSSEIRELVTAFLSVTEEEEIVVAAEEVRTMGTGEGALPVFRDGTIVVLELLIAVDTEETIMVVEELDIEEVAILLTVGAEVVNIEVAVVAGAGAVLVTGAEAVSIAGIEVLTLETGTVIEVAAVDAEIVGEAFLVTLLILVSAEAAVFVFC